MATLSAKILRRKIAAVTPARAILRFLYTHRRLLGKRAEAAIFKLANPKLSHFVPSDIDIGEFFGRLDELKVEYVVLRWFEGLPDLDRKHDLDLLVADDSIKALESELTHWPVGHPVDLFSLTGGRKKDRSSVSITAIPTQLFPDRIARRIMDQRLKFKGICYVPSPQDHFCALAYHATYIKGAASGLAARGRVDANAPAASHDYAAALRALGARVGITVPAEVTRDWLDSLLTELGWRPDPAELASFGLGNPAGAPMQSG